MWKEAYVYCFTEGRIWAPLMTWTRREAVVCEVGQLWGSLWDMSNALSSMPGNRKEVKIAEEEKLDMKNFLNLKNNAIWTRMAVDPSGEEADSRFQFWLYYLPALWSWANYLTTLCVLKKNNNNNMVPTS